MKIKGLKRIKERYREAPLWIATVESENGEREQLATKTLKEMLTKLSKITGIPFNANTKTQTVA